MSKTNIPAGGLPCDQNRSDRNALWFAGRCRRTKTEAGRMGRQGGKSMSEINIPAGGCPVTKTEAAGTAFGLRDGAEEPRQKPAAWAGKEGKV